NSKLELYRPFLYIICSDSYDFKYLIVKNIYSISQPHRLSCPHAGQWQILFFRKKVSKKLSPAPDAMSGSALTISSIPHQPRAN
ncbi:hypothetical protein, partial [Pedobacter alpinus]